MTLWNRFRSWLQATLRRSRMESDMDKELRFHVEAYAQDLIRSGISREEATRRAKAEFGGAEGVKEECREARGVTILGSLTQDIRYGLRMLRKSPGFTAVAVLTLAFGIGANTAIFSAVNGILFDPLPYADASRILTISEQHRVSNDATIVYASPFSPPAQDILSHCPAFERIAKYQGAAGFSVCSVTVLGGTQPELATIAHVSADFFPMLGAQPVLGRYIVPGDTHPGSDRVVVLNYRLWQDDFGGNASILGHRIVLDDKPYSVVGVMPKEFDLGLGDKGVWIPLIPLPGKESGAILARLRKGVTLAQANAELAVFSGWLPDKYPNFQKGDQLFATGAEDSVVGRVRTQLMTLLGAVGLVLLIACVNVSALLVARSWTRRKEIAIRAALGASRSRVVRQLLSESLLLATAGGALAMLVAFWGTTILRRMVPLFVPRRDHIALDGRVLWFTLGVSLVAAVLFGLAPALQSSSRRLANALKAGLGGSFAAPVGRQRHHLRRMLLVVQLALTVILVCAAALMVRSFENLLHVNTGIRADHVLTMRVGFSRAVCDYQSPLRCNLATNEILRRVRALPGVEQAAMSEGTPINGGYEMGRTLYVEGGSTYNFDGDIHPPGVHTVTPDYFAALGIRLLQGRDFDASDTRSSPKVAIVSQSFAKLYLSGSPSASRFSTSEDKNGTHDWIEVVGVVSDTLDSGLQSDPGPLVYFPAAQTDPGSSLIVHTAVNPMTLAAAVEKQVWAVDKNAPISALATMNQILARATDGAKFDMALFSAFGIFALALAMVGVYGVTSCAAEQRTHEIGVRMALGAQPRDVLRLILTEEAWLAVVGIIIGLFGAWGATRVLGGMLFQIKPADPATFLASALLLAAAALLACYIPARRATCVDPLVALRYE